MGARAARARGPRARRKGATGRPASARPPRQEVPAARRAPPAVLARAAVLLHGLRAAAAQAEFTPESAPPGLQRWLGRDRCGDQRWTAFHAGLGEVAGLFNAREFAPALQRSAELLLPVVTDPHVAFDCATAVSSVLGVGAQCGDQLGLPRVAARLRQLGAIFGSFDYQMKGNEYIDQSPWPINWMENMEGILSSMAYLKQHELQVDPWRGAPTSAALSQKLGPGWRSTAQPLRIAIVSVCDYDPGVTPLARLSQINKEEYANMHGYVTIIHERAPVFSDPLSPLLTEPASHRPPAWSKVDAVLAALASGRYDWVMWMDCDPLRRHEVALEGVVAMAEAEHAASGEGPAAPGDLPDLQRLVGRWLEGPPEPLQGAALLGWFDDLLDEAAGAGGAPGAAEGGAANRTLGWGPWLLEERRAHVVASEDGLMLNTGVMLIRASVWSWRFFSKVRWMTFGVSPVTQHPWWEQAAMVYLLQLPLTLVAAASGRPEDLGPPAAARGHSRACALLSQRHLNAYPPLVASALQTHVAYDAGDFVVSFSGCKVYSSQEVCNQPPDHRQAHGLDVLRSDPVLRLWL
ncbi:unnamed protein product [Prorocentrum cordatum]|uniref:Uncharacterized protein n=1 Tax=Prorocentrum cordatum TaxID=2364126 RepID=A0ABN9TDQ5_9DINO|nr:unnamed protein product [Polarella glacialis]